MAPLFILTCMRSYSSLVSAMLGQHSGLYCLPEVNPFIAETLGAGVDVLEMVRKRTLDGLYRAVAEMEFGAQTEATIAAAKTWVSQRRGWSPVQLMAHFAAQVAPRRLIEKSPSTVLNIDRLDQALALFPEAYFLHLYRHPVATCSSIAKITLAAQGARAQSTRDPEVSWFGANRAILQLSTKIPAGQFMAVRGEDVLGDPDLYLGQICLWLGLDTRPQDFRDMRQPENSPYACLGPPSAPFGADPGFLKHPRYVKRAIDLPPLETPLAWAAPGRRLRTETVDLAYQLGYA